MDTSMGTQAFGEFLGTFILIILGDGVVGADVQVVYSRIIKIHDI